MGESSSSLGDQTTAPLPREGEIIGTKYRLVRPIAEGGMGIVFEAVHLRLRQSVAIKFPRQDVVSMSDAVERFEREARASGRMRGPHVVHVLDVDTDAYGRPYIVMELLRGRDLEAELRARGPMPIAQAVDWTLQACRAVAQAHGAGVVHRDLKPSNLFLAEEAGASVIKVLDFGVSKVADDAEAAGTSTSVTVGTPLYMSPEQVHSSNDVDERTDVWSLGVILYELIAGVPPFRGTTTAAIVAIVAGAVPSLRAVRPDVPEELECAVMTALARAPEDRFPTAESFGAALMPFASKEGVAGPFSLSPSQRAFAVACSTMARAPRVRAAPRVRDPSELLEPRGIARDARDAIRIDGSGRTATLLRRTGRKHSRRVAVRTFASTMMVGVGVSTAVTLAIPSPTRGAKAVDHPSAGAAEVLEPTPPPSVSNAHAIVAGADPAVPPSTVGTSSRPCGAAPLQLDCRKPSGSSGGGGSAIRRSSEP
jgi:serine/threonine-protein kinase